MEEIALINIDDEITGYCEKLEVHKKGLLHRAFSIFIVNDKGEMLIQRRNENKYHSGGLWTNACCSHQRKGEELSEAIHRRLQEEMGFDCKLEEKFNFVYRTEFKDSLVEYELDHVFVGYYSGEVSLNMEETSEFKWIDIAELKEDLTKHAEKYTSWFIIATPKLIEGVK